jgi:hypothetical protein
MSGVVAQRILSACLVNWSWIVLSGLDGFEQEINLPEGSTST